MNLSYSHIFIKNVDYRFLMTSFCLHFTFLFGVYLAYLQLNEKCDQIWIWSIKSIEQIWAGKSYKM